MKKYISIEDYFKEQNNIKVQKKLLKNIIFILCLLILIFSIYNILNWQINNSKIRQINNEINEIIDIKNNSEEQQLVNPPNNLNDNYFYYINFPFFSVNFSKLLLKNNNTVGFIKISNTHVNYPVVQTSDNEFYLNHSFDKSENKAGWIFLDFRGNLIDLVDNNVIYGHSRLDGTLFGSLNNVLTSNWQDNKDNYVIYLSTLKENMLFQIFSIYTIPKESYYITPNFASIEKKKVWLNEMKKRNVAPINTLVNENDKILTLSTCQNNYGGRIVIHSKLIKKQKNIAL